MTLNVTEEEVRDRIWIGFVIKGTAEVHVWVHVVGPVVGFWVGVRVGNLVGGGVGGSVGGGVGCGVGGSVGRGVGGGVGSLLGLLVGAVGRLFGVVGALAQATLNVVEHTFEYAAGVPPSIHASHGLNSELVIVAEEVPSMKTVILV
jgi:hypothetical protein